MLRKATAVSGVFWAAPAPPQGAAGIKTLGERYRADRSSARRRRYPRPPAAFRRAPSDAASAGKGDGATPQRRGVPGPRLRCSSSGSPLGAASGRASAGGLLPRPDPPCKRARLAFPPRAVGGSAVAPQSPGSAAGSVTVQPRRSTGGKATGRPDPYPPPAPPQPQSNPSAPAPSPAGTTSPRPGQERWSPCKPANSLREWAADRNFRTNCPSLSDSLVGN